MHAQLLRLCLRLCNPMDCSLLGSSVHGILQARILEWLAMPSSRRSSQPRDWTCVKPVSLTSPALAGGFFTTSTTWETLCSKFVGFPEVRILSWMHPFESLQILRCCLPSLLYHFALPPAIAGAWYSLYSLTNSVIKCLNFANLESWKMAWVLICFSLIWLACIPFSVNYLFISCMYVILFINLFLAVLGLHLLCGLSLVADSRSYSAVAVPGLLIVVASLVEVLGLSGLRASVDVVCGLRGCRSQALEHRLNSWGAQA